MPKPLSPPAPARPLSLGVIFLTLYIDLVGFSIIFPLAPSLMDYYLRVDGQSGVLGWLQAESGAISRALGHDQGYAAVLLGGIVMSFYSILQFIFSPVWGGFPTATDAAPSCWQPSRGRRLATWCGFSAARSGSFSRPAW